MKKLLLIIVTITISVQTFGNKEPEWANEKQGWEYFRNFFSASSVKTFHSDIKIQLIGDFSHEDSSYLKTFINDLQPLVQREWIFFVKTGGNFLIELYNNPDTSIRASEPKIVEASRLFLTSDTIRNSKLFNYYASTVSTTYGIKRLSWCTKYGQKGTELINISFMINPDCPQVLRNKLISYHIINSFIGKNSYSFDKSIKEQEFRNYLSNGLFSIKEFKEIDKYVIYHGYLNSPFYHFLTKHPKHILEYSKVKLGNYFIIISDCLAFILLLLYFMMLFRFRVMETQVISWKGYLKKGMLVLQSATLLYIFYAYNERYLFYHNAHPLVFLLITLLIPNLSSFLSLNIVYFFEKYLIRDKTNIAQRLTIQFLATLIPVVIIILSVHFVYGLKQNYLFISYLMFFSFFFIIIRMGYNYLEFRTQNTIKEKDLELSHLREMQHKAELQALHSRINPHFLYNSLNSIAGLAKTDPNKTEEMALALSDFCRYAINKQNETFATVEEELLTVQTYLEIEKVRFGERLEYSLAIEENCKILMIPRFILQPLLENAVKHGISKIIGKGIIKLKITKQDKDLVITVSDNGPAFPDTPINGYGLQSIFDKLEILYKGKAKINWEDSPEKKILIFIPFSH